MMRSIILMASGFKPDGTGTTLAQMISCGCQCRDAPLARINGNRHKMLIINKLYTNHQIRAKGTSVQ